MSLIKVILCYGKQPDIQASTEYVLYIKKLSGDCYMEISCSPFNININSENNRVPLSAGTYVARATGLYGKIMSNLIQFTVSQSVEVIIPQPTPFSVSTYENTANRLRASNGSGIVSNAKIYQKTDNQLIEKGYTDENGQLFAEFLPALQAGDVLVAEAEGYETLEGIVTQAMIDNNIISLLLNRESSAKIVNPQVQIVNYKPVFTENMVTFNVSAENLNAYRITLLPDCECEPEITETYAAGQSSVSITGLSEGANIFEISFFNEIDTLSLYRTVYYNPNTTETDTYNVITIQATTESLGARLYVSGVFVKEIEHSGEVVVIPAGIHQLLFEKDGYKPYRENVDISTTVSLSLKKTGGNDDDCDNYFSDFTNNVFDTNLWTKDLGDNNENDIRVEDGIMKLEQNSTDVKTYLVSKELAFGSSITLERDVYLHSESDYFYAETRFDFDNSKGFMIGYHNDYYEGGYLHEIHNKFCTMTTGESVEYSKWEDFPLETILDKWFHEKVEINKTTGKLQYFVNGELLGERDMSSIMSGATSVQPVTSVTLDKSALTITVGANGQLSATVAPAPATNKAVTWSSGNTSVATVNSTGKVTAVGPGTATITVKTTDGGHVATCTITVVQPVTSVSLDKSAVTLSSGGTTQLTVTVMPSNATDKTVTWSSGNTSVATVNYCKK